MLLNIAGKKTQKSQDNPHQHSHVLLVEETTKGGLVILCQDQRFLWYTAGQALGSVGPKKDIFGMFSQQSCSTKTDNSGNQGRSSKSLSRSRSLGVGPLEVTVHGIHQYTYSAYPDSTTEMGSEGNTAPHANQIHFSGEIVSSHSEIP